jgi:YidC/Oxa1 family membrane protein insertase
MTDQQRNLLAFALCGLVLVGYFVIQRWLYPPAAATTQPAATQEAASRPAAATTSAPAAAPPRAVTTAAATTAVSSSLSTDRPLTAAARTFTPANVAPQDDLVLGSADPSNPGKFRLRVVLTNRGAAVTQVALAHYRNVDRTGPMVVFGLDPERKVFAHDPSLLPPTWPLAERRLLLLNYYADAAPHKVYDLENVNFEVVERTDRRVAFETTVLPDAVRIRKTFELAPESYAVNLEVTLTNLGTAPQAFAYQLESASDLPREQLRIGHGTPWSEIEAALVIRSGGSFNTRYEQAESLEEQAEQAAQWGDLAGGETATAAGLVNRYFAVTVLPRDTVDQKRIHFVRAAKALDLHYYAELQTDRKGGHVRTQLSLEQLEGFAKEARINAAVRLVTRAENLAPGEAAAARHHYVLFAGPKDPAALAPYAAWGLPELFSYHTGILNPIAGALEWLLRFFHRIPPHNYGLAIILLTLVVRAAMHPLTRKQSRSMRGLQNLKPQIDKLKEQYKGDRQGFGRAQMDLYKQHGYNPVSGCLPMLLQMPIFIALYQALRVSPALRQAPFVWPVIDLSQPDVLLPLGFTIPLIFERVDTLRLLPILSMAAMFLSQRLTPKPPSANDQQARTQQRMMVFMFVLFGVMLYNVASGLLLYITVSSFIGILEQWHIRKSLERLEAQGGVPVKVEAPMRRPPVAKRRRR